MYKEHMAEGFRVIGFALPILVLSALVSFFFLEGPIFFIIVGGFGLLLIAKGLVTIIASYLQQSFGRKIGITLLFLIIFLILASMVIYSTFLT